MATTESIPITGAAPVGGGFLLEDFPAGTAFISEDFTEEQRQIGSTADRFVTEEVLSRIDQFEAQEPGLCRKLMKQAGDLGLLAVGVPEPYGGLELDMTSGQVVAERIGRYDSF